VADYFESMHYELPDDFFDLNNVLLLALEKSPVPERVATALFALIVIGALLVPPTAIGVALMSVEHYNFAGGGTGGQFRSVTYYGFLRWMLIGALAMTGASACVLVWRQVTEWRTCLWRKPLTGIDIEC
jgi:hypothetical protein